MIASSDSVPLLAEYSRDGSGYVRQAVLARCVELARPELLAAVAERLNDWVPQQRQFLLSEPVMSAFGQLLSLQELMLLRHDLLR